MGRVRIRFCGLRRRWRHIRLEINLSDDTSRRRVSFVKIITIVIITTTTTNLRAQNIVCDGRPSEFPRRVFERGRFRFSRLGDLTIFFFLNSSRSTFSNRVRTVKSRWKFRVVFKKTKKNKKWLNSRQLHFCFVRTLVTSAKMPCVRRWRWNPY